MIKFYAPDLSDKRISYAADSLEKHGYRRVFDEKNADFLLLGVNSDYKSDIPFADYKNNKLFALKNAYLTAEAALCVAIEKSNKSLVSSNVLITGYGRIAKALHKYISPFTGSVTVCARNPNDRVLAACNNAKVIDFADLKNKNSFDFVFNTVPHPVFNGAELSALPRDCVLIDLASFPGGVDKHYALSRKINLIEARGLPGKFSPETAGHIVAEAVDQVIREGKI